MYLVCVAFGVQDVSNLLVPFSNLKKLRITKWPVQHILTLPVSITTFIIGIEPENVRNHKGNIFIGEAKIDKIGVYKWDAKITRHKGSVEAFIQLCEMFPTLREIRIALTPKKKNIAQLENQTSSMILGGLYKDVLGQSYVRNLELHGISHKYSTLRKQLGDLFESMFSHPIQINFST